MWFLRVAVFSLLLPLFTLQINSFKIKYGNPRNLFIIKQIIPKNMYEFKTLIGYIEIDDNFNIIGIDTKSKGLSKLPPEQLKPILEQLRAYVSDYRAKNIEVVKGQIRESIEPEILVIQSIRIYEELNKVANMLLKRLRELFEYNNPELSKDLEDNVAFVNKILSVEDLNSLREKNSMGKSFDSEALDIIRSLALRIKDLYNERGKNREYIDNSLRLLMPNTHKIAGAIIAAKLLEHAGSLRRLMELPASTIQLFGAEKALFRHITKGSKSPKHGLLLNHPIVQKSKDKGKAARLLADKLSIALRVDYFKGEFIADRLIDEINVKLGIKDD
jgi:nucleolar protein 56